MLFQEDWALFQLVNPNMRKLQVFTYMVTDSVSKTTALSFFPTPLLLLDQLSDTDVCSFIVSYKQRPSLYVCHFVFSHKRRRGQLHHRLVTCAEKDLYCVFVALSLSTVMLPDLCEHHILSMVTTQWTKLIKITVSCVIFERNMTHAGTHSYSSVLWVIIKALLFIYPLPWCTQVFWGTLKV